MTIHHSIWQVIPAPWRGLARRLAYFVAGTLLTFFYAQIGQAQNTANTPIVQNPYSVETILAALIGAVITIFFLRGMYLVLTYASQTYGISDDQDEDTAEIHRENNLLLYGAFGWILGSALVIASYGWGWQFLYIGPILCLLGPLVPILAMYGDIKKYRQILADRVFSTSWKP
jgi:hypothetical protein